MNTERKLSDVFILMIEKTKSKDFELKHISSGMCNLVIQLWHNRVITNTELLEVCKRIKYHPVISRNRRNAWWYPRGSYWMIRCLWMRKQVLILRLQGK